MCVCVCVCVCSSNSDVLPGTGAADGSSAADKYFIPFELACKSNVPRIINTSLDCIQVSYLGYHLIHVHVLYMYIYCMYY